MENHWMLHLKGHNQLLVTMQKYSSESERIINRVLKEEGAALAMKEIVARIPVSNEQLRKGHRHAKFSDPLTVKYINLGFIIRPNKKFEYIKFPDLGIGRSVGNEPEEFMQRGLAIALDPITEALLKGFDELKN